MQNLADGRDLVIRNARVHTQNPDQPGASSLLIRDGRIAQVSEQPIEAAGAMVVDAGGASVVPGFNDVHAHSVWFGLTKLELDVSIATDVDHLYDLIAQRAAADTDAAAAAGRGHGSRDGGDWIIAAGFNHISLGERYPDRDRLDRAAGGRPVWLKHNSGHAAFVNGAALGLIAERSDLSAPIEGGVVVRDENGRPTGLLEENAMALVQQLALPYPTETIVQALDLATRHYLGEGITSVTDAGIAGGWIGYSPREFGAYQEARDRGILHTRMQPMFVIDALHRIAGHADDPRALGLDGGIRTGFGDDWLQLGPVKIFSDGSLLGSTAAMTEHYAGCPGNHGYLQESPESLRERALGAYASGWSIAIHAIGDSAIDHVIDIIDEAQRLFGRRRVPNRIEHAAVVREDQLARIAELGIAVTPQPYFLYEFGDALIERLGREREPQLYRARTFLDSGIVLPGSSDRPVADGNVLAAIQSFVERKSAAGNVIGAPERITAAEALAAYTLGSARATGLASSRGSLEPGKLADLVVLGDDPLAVDSSRIGGIEVVATMVDGSFAHGADRF